MHQAQFNLRSANFILFFTSTFFYFGSFYSLIPAMPLYAQLLGGTPAEIGLVVGSYTLSAILGRPYFGKRLERQGRKKHLVYSSAWAIVCFLLYSQITNIYVLCLVRIIHGFAHACFIIASSIYIADIVPQARRGEVFGIYGTASVLAMAVFPAISAYLIKNISFTCFFLLAAMLAIICFLTTLPLRELLGYTKQEASDNFIKISLRKVILLPSLALFSAASAYGAVTTFFPIFANQMGLSDWGNFFTFYAVSNVLGRVLTGRLSDRIGRKKLIVPCMLLTGIAVYQISISSDIWLLYGSAVMLGLGFGAFYPMLNALVNDHVSSAERSKALGFYTAFMDIGVTFSAVALSGFSISTIFKITSIIVMISTIIFTLFMPTKAPLLANGKKYGFEG